VKQYLKAQKKTYEWRNNNSILNAVVSYSRNGIIAFNVGRAGWQTASV